MKKALAIFLFVTGIFVIVLPLTTYAYAFLHNLQQGSSGPDVMALQKVLNLNPLTKVAQTGPGSPGSETSFFGAATKKAVIAFQELYRDEILVPAGLLNGNGFVGALTRKKLTAISATTTIGSTPSQSPATSQSSQLVYVPYTSTYGNLSPTYSTTSATTSAQVTTTVTADNIPVITGLSSDAIGNGDKLTIYGRNFLPTDTVLVSIELPDKFANIPTASSTSLQFTFYSTLSSSLKLNISKYSPKIQSAILDKIQTKMMATTPYKDAWYMSAYVAVKNANGTSNTYPIRINILKGL